MIGGDSVQALLDIDGLEQQIEILYKDLTARIKEIDTDPKPGATFSLASIAVTLEATPPGTGEFFCFFGPDG